LGRSGACRSEEKNSGRLARKLVAAMLLVYPQEQWDRSAQAAPSFYNSDQNTLMFGRKLQRALTSNVSGAYKHDTNLLTLVLSIARLAKHIVLIRHSAIRSKVFYATAKRVLYNVKHVLNRAVYHKHIDDKNRAENKWKINDITT
jgi:hypothetical protein